MEQFFFLWEPRSKKELSAAVAALHNGGVILQNLRHDLEADLPPPERGILPYLP